MQHRALTRFAPAERVTADVIRRQADAIDTLDLMRSVLDASPSAIMVLNSRRQMVYANHAMLALAGATDPWSVLGRRPGEALGCIHANAAEMGCGTSEACRFCGAVLCTLEGLKGRSAKDECRLIRIENGRPEWLELEVSASPVNAAGETFVAISLVDIGDRKRRRALERIFFHDVLNTAGSLQGMADVTVRRAPEGELRDYAETMRGVARQLTNEIAAQRTLAAAESGELGAEPASLAALELLREEVERFRGYPAFSERCIEIDPASEDMQMVSDRVLLGRVLGNMLRNALEATPAGGCVRAGCGPAGENVEFRVWNPGGMPPGVQLQIFQRSFSTKRGGRGLGTYGMKLLTERLLGGAVSFHSSDREGTEFRARYPRVLRRSTP